MSLCYSLLKINRFGLYHFLVKLDLPNFTNWGTLGAVEYCPFGSYVKAARIRIEAAQGTGDDSGVNAVELECQRQGSNQVVRKIRSSQTFYGEWRERFSCNDGFVKGGRLRSEDDLGTGRLNQWKSFHFLFFHLCITYYSKLLNSSPSLD